MHLREFEGKFGEKGLDKQHWRGVIQYLPKKWDKWWDLKKGFDRESDKKSDTWTNIEDKMKER